MKQKFEVELLEEAFEFLQKIDLKDRIKVLQNINRARFSNDPKLFKKLNEDIWEFRTRFGGTQYRLLAFWDKTNNNQTLVFATHGFKKKKSKVDKKEIDKAERIRLNYFKNKKP